MYVIEARYTYDNMNVVYFEKPGGLDVLKYGSLPTSISKKGGALVRVRACALNRLDIWLRKGRWGISMPHIPGSDVTGIIEKLNGKSILKIGQEVVINPAIPCKTCLSCQKGLPCERVKIFGYKMQGGYAEYVTAPIEQLYPKPKHLSFIEAAAFPLTFLTAWHMLVTRANLQKSETVFIWGASGGLGTAAIQVAKYLGARVIAATRSDSTARQLKKIGADDSVIYTKGGVEQAVKRLTGGRGVEVVFESVGKETWQTSPAILAPFGRIVIAGTTSGSMAKQDLSDVYFRQLSIIGARMGTKEEFEKVLNLVDKGKLKPVIDKVFPLEKAKDAQKRMEEGRHVGKIVLEN